MNPVLADYRELAGAETIEELKVLASRASHIRSQNINATAVGGPVAEKLTRLIPILQELEVDASWDVMRGNNAFFSAARALQGALQGGASKLSEALCQIYRDTMQLNMGRLDFEAAVILLHEAHPAGLVMRKKEIGRRWIWRCHFDISSPSPDAWEFFREYFELFDAAVFLTPDFACPFRAPRYMVAPSIDPLSDRNRELEDSFIRSVLEQHSVDPGRPVIIQTSPFTRARDAHWAITAYRLARKRCDCQLVLAACESEDRPELGRAFDEIRGRTDDEDIHVLLLPPFSDLQLNALVRGSTIVMHDSLDDGFGLAVSEALWKAKPVVGAPVGGIKLQVINAVTGFLARSPEGAAARVLQLLTDPVLRRALGANGREHVRQNYLLPRHVKDYLLLLLALEHEDEDVVWLG